MHHHQPHHHRQRCSFCLLSRVLICCLVFLFFFSSLPVVSCSYLLSRVLIVFIWYTVFLQVLEIARTEMKQSNNDTAKDLFIQRLDEPDMYFTGGDAIPKNESNEAAYTKCVSEETARMFCPTRWAAMQRWFNEARRVWEIPVKLWW